jgi:hypothetical protein
MDTNIVTETLAEPLGPGDRRDILAEVALQEDRQKILG